MPTIISDEMKLTRDLVLLALKSSHKRGADGRDIAIAGLAAIREFTEGNIIDPSQTNEYNKQQIEIELLNLATVFQR